MLLYFLSNSVEGFCLHAVLRAFFREALLERAILLDICVKSSFLSFLRTPFVKAAWISAAMRSSISRALEMYESSITYCFMRTHVTTASVRGSLMPVWIFVKLCWPSLRLFDRSAKSQLTDFIFERH